MPIGPGGPFLPFGPGTPYKKFIIGINDYGNSDLEQASQ